MTQTPDLPRDDAGVQRHPNGRFITPPKSPGRPVGPTEAEIIRAHLEPKKEAVLNKLAELAGLGDPRSMELFLRYFSPGARPEDEKIVVPGLESAATLEGKAAAIVAAVSKGQISAAAGMTALSLLEKVVRVVVADEHERRLKALEQARAPVLIREHVPTLGVDDSPFSEFA